MDRTLDHSPFSQLIDYKRFAKVTSTKTENFDLSAKRILRFSGDTRMNSPLAVDGLNIWPRIPLPDE